MLTVAKQFISFVARFRVLCNFCNVMLSAVPQIGRYLISYEILLHVDVNTLYSVGSGSRIRKLQKIA